MPIKKVVLLSVLYQLASTRNLIKYLKRRYSHQIVQNLNAVLKLKGKHVRAVENVAFLEKCLEFFVVPLYISRRVKKTKAKRSWPIERALLRDEINQHKDLIGITRQNYHQALPTTLQQLSFFDRLRFCKLLNENAVRTEHQMRFKKNKNLLELRKLQLGLGELNYNTIINLSGEDLTEAQMEVLCRGLKYGVPSKPSPVLIESEFELCWQQIDRLTPVSEDKKQDCKTGLADISRRYAKEKVDRSGFPLNSNHFHAIRELKKNRDLVITRPDKGSGVVLLKRSDYLAKMRTILSNEKKFIELGTMEENDNTLQQERALQAFLLRAHKAGHLTREVYERIRPSGTNRPRMYGVPKVHKPEVPLRPILSMSNAPQHAMAKWLMEILNPVVNKFAEHTIRDTFEFCDNIEHFQGEHDSTSTFMCSFDIESLFTNIPLTETINICLDTLYRDDNISPPTIPESLLKKMLVKATTEVEFSLDNTMYRQIDGVAMGSPLGPVLANIFVGYCETKVDPSQWPLLYDRFVDDTFAIFNSESESKDFFSLLNGLHPGLRFTVENELNGELPFMDVLVQRKDDALLKSVYRKPTFTGLYTRWDSFSPTNRKINLIKSLTSRAVKICSKSTLAQEINNLKTLFAKNGYPTEVVNRTIQMEIDRHEKNAITKASNADDTRSKFVVLRLPWLGQVSNRYRKQVVDVISDSYPQVQPRVVFTTTPNFNGRAKDVLPTTSRSQIVYEFTCSCGLTYVGKTTQCLSVRIDQHIPRKILDSTPDLRKHRADSAITRHLKENPDCISKALPTKAFRILVQARSKPQLDVLEALFIKRLAPHLCNQKDYVQHLTLTC